LLIKKRYSSEQEYRYRLSIYKDNLNFIESTNRLNLCYKLAMNKFGDLTHEEFKMQMNKYRHGDKKRSNQLHRYNPRSDLPDDIDWRKKNVVTPVKDQGQCGSCWAFSAIGSTEGAHALATGKLVSLSEQNLVDCSSKEGNFGCNGGLMDQAFKYIIQNKGIDTEESYPYKATDGQCQFSNSTIGATLTSYIDIAQGSEDSLKDAVANVGPISVAIDASQKSFQFYSSGVYYDEKCSSSQLDHGVLVVGYGKEVDKDYWMVKNSWGTMWGMQGYIMMARNRNNTCGISTASSYPKVY